jgi:hypothetical protein
VFNRFAFIINAFARYCAPLQCSRSTDIAGNYADLKSADTGCCHCKGSMKMKKRICYKQALPVNAAKRVERSKQNLGNRLPKNKIEKRTEHQWRKILQLVLLYVLTSPINVVYRRKGKYRQLPARSDMGDYHFHHL